MIQEITGTLCGNGYPDKLAHQDIVSGMYPLVPPGILMKARMLNLWKMKKYMSFAV